MEQNKLNAQLIQFAVEVLNILERDESWSGDTLDDICMAADMHKLSSTDENGNFKSILNEKD